MKTRSVMRIIEVHPEIAGQIITGIHACLKCSGKLICIIWDINFRTVTPCLGQIAVTFSQP